MRGCSRKKIKGSQVDLKWFFHPSLLSHLHIFINVKLFARLSQDDLSPEAFVRAVSAPWEFREQAYFPLL